MDIKVGEYVRTKYGIAKVIRDNKDEKAYFDNYDIDKELDGCNFINDFEIFNHSSDILDLIEKGDFVNGYKVLDLEKKEDRIMICVLKLKSTEHWITLDRQDIQDIVTKEQHERGKYVVGG